MEIPKVTLKQIYKFLGKRASLSGMQDPVSLLETEDSAYSKWFYLYNIVEQALLEFDFYCPVTRVERLYLKQLRDFNYDIIPNFDPTADYEAAGMELMDVCVKPMSISGLGYTPNLNACTPMRTFHYANGLLTDMIYFPLTKSYYANVMHRHPLFQEWVTPDGKIVVHEDRIDCLMPEEDEKDRQFVRDLRPTDKCGVYFISKDSQVEFTFFMDMIFLEFAKAVLNNKKNMTLAEMPLEILGGLEEEMQEVKQRVEDRKLNSQLHGQWQI